jgi:threonine/homoserine/homoserine lactone efflux protein
MDFFWHFIVGLLVSFLGSIPLGTVNLAVIQTTININFKAGFYFALGATMIELIYSAIAIKFIAVLIDNNHIELIIQMITIPVFLMMGIFYFRKEDKAKAASTKKRRSFYNGLFVGLINPMQIPFWITYGSYMLSNDWIKNEDGLLNIFILGICTGTLLVLTMIALLSKTLISKFDLSTRWVNKGIGIILFALSAYQAVKVAKHFIGS